MLTLALDTTTRAGSVAVVRDETVLAIVHGDVARTHGERLPAELAQALREAGAAMRDIQLLAVASGPGAFTGLRIGLATMQGLAMVLQVPVVAVSALDALALSTRRGTDDASLNRLSAQGPSPAVAAWMDAQRGEVFAAFYAPSEDYVSVSSATPTPIVGHPDVILEAMPGFESIVFIGDGALRYRAQILQTAGARHLDVAVFAPPPALAPLIALIGQQRAARGEAGPPHALQPLYVRRPDAELERLRRATAVLGGLRSQSEDH